MSHGVCHLKIRSGDYGNLNTTKKKKNLKCRYLPCCIVRILVVVGSKKPIIVIIKLLHSELLGFYLSNINNQF